MTQFQQFRRALAYDRVAMQRLLLSLLLGSLLGACCARLHAEQYAGQLCSRPGPCSGLGLCMRTSLFPLLLTLALLLERRRVFPLLFFCKGAAAAYLLCSLSAAGAGLSRLLPFLLLNTVLPLPALFLCGAAWSESEEAPGAALWLLLPVLILSWIGIILCKLFHVVI